MMKTLAHLLVGLCAAPFFVFCLLWPYWIKETWKLLIELGEATCKKFGKGYRRRSKP